MFNTTPKGFHIKFANGNTVSVQFGRGNYCDNRTEDENKPCANAEVWAWDDSGIPLFDDPLGYQTPEEVLALMMRYSA